MALPAGRKGVLASELTPEGKIKDSGGGYVLPTASAETLGGVKVGTGLSITDAGVLNASGYELPTASAETLGGVKVGEGLTITEQGVLSASGGSATGLYRHGIKTNQIVCKWLVIETADSTPYADLTALVNGMKTAGYTNAGFCYAMGCGHEPSDANNIANYYAVNADNYVAGYKYDGTSNSMVSVGTIYSPNTTLTDTVTKII